MRTFDFFDEENYIAPSVAFYEIYPEGVICASGSNESFTEDDSWQDLFN